MGQQQLLLITLGVIIVGIAITTGIAYFKQKSVDSNRDGVIIDLNTLANDAGAYYKKPKSMGGGGSSYIGFSISPLLDTTGNGHYYILSSSGSKISIRGVGVESVGSAVSCNSNANKVQYTIEMDDNQDRVLTKNN